MQSYDNLKENGIRYGGHNGYKLGVIIDGKNWFLKFPQSTRNFLYYFTIIRIYRISYL